MLKSRSTNNIPFIDTTNFTLSKSNKYQLHYVLYIFVWALRYSVQQERVTKFRTYLILSNAPWSSSVVTVSNGKGTQQTFT